MSKKVLVVGGGAAGWLAALFCKKMDPSLNVELIESEEIGIIGAGESTTSTFYHTLRILDIDIREFVKETDATIKTSIKFDDWDFPGSSYLSTFSPWFSGSSKGPSWGVDFQVIKSDQLVDYNIYCYVNNIDINKTGMHKLILENKAPVVQFNQGDNESYSFIQGLTYNINAKMTAKYFRKVAESRGIIRHEGKIIKINGHYPIESLEDDKGRVHKVDFVFDCSGLARLINGKHFKEEWIDYSKYLPVNSTIPFFLPTEEKIPTYVNATAMKYGWMFKVPTQNRYGAGYCYDSNLISKEQAIDEVQKKLGHTVQLVNHFNFKGGMFKNNFVSNCITLGLASNFLEPMAATNLSTVCVALQDILYRVKKAKDIDAVLSSKDFKIHFNSAMRLRIEVPAISEIFSHYVNNRTDTEFWMYFKNKENYPPVFRHAYEECFSGDNFDFRKFSEMTNFMDHTMITKLIGNNWFREKAIKYCEKYNINETYAKVHADIVRYTDFISPYVLDHRDYLERVCRYD